MHIFDNSHILNVTLNAIPHLDLLLVTLINGYEKRQEESAVS